MKTKLYSKVPQIKVICDYLISECSHDDHLGKRVMLEEKTVDKMYGYILSKVKHDYKDQMKNNGVMVKDEDVYSMAIHYFLESDEDLQKEFPGRATKAEIKANTQPKVEGEPRRVAKVRGIGDKVEEGQTSIFDFGVDV